MESKASSFRTGEDSQKESEEAPRPEIADPIDGDP